MSKIQLSRFLLLASTQFYCVMEEVICFPSLWVELNALSCDFYKVNFMPTTADSRLRFERGFQVTGRSVVLWGQ